MPSQSGRFKLYYMHPQNSRTRLQISRTRVLLQGRSACQYAMSNILQAHKTTATYPGIACKIVVTKHDSVIFCERWSRSRVYQCRHTSTQHPLKRVRNSSMFSVVNISFISAKCIQKRIYLPPQRRNPRAANNDTPEKHITRHQLKRTRN